MRSMEAVEPHVDPTFLKISNLIGVCHRSEQALASVIQSSPRTEFRECVGRVRELLHEFGYQLRVELRRIEHEGAGRQPEEQGSAANDPDSSLRYLLESYLRVGDSHLPPHTRAMVKRQHDQLQRVCDEFKQFVAALQGLLDDNAGRTA